MAQFLECCLMVRALLGGEAMFTQSDYQKHREACQSCPMMLLLEQPRVEIRVPN